MTLRRGIMAEKRWPATNLRFVGASSTSHTNATGTLTLTSLQGGMRSAAQSGDVVFVFYNVAVVPTDGYPTLALATSGYTKETQVNNFGSASRTSLAVFRKLLSSAETSVSLTALTTNYRGSAAALVYSGVNATPLDVAIVAASGADAVLADCPSITPANAGAFMLFIEGSAGDNAGFTHVAPLSTQLIRQVGSSAAGAIEGGHISVAGTPWSGSGGFNPTAFGGSPAGGVTGHCWVGLSMAIRSA